jgi:membrane protease YdiL (CAAX protease family)
MNVQTHKKLDWRGIGWFIIISYVLIWLLVLPMYLDGKGLNSPWAALTLMMNFCPTVATLIVTRWVSPLPQTRRATGLRWGVKGSRWSLYYLFGWLAFVGMSLAAPFVAAAFGLYSLDLANFSGFRASLEAGYGAQGAQQMLSMGPIQVVVLFGLGFTLLYALLITPLTFGEEWGWRGYLLPQLLPLGQWPALLLSGAIWGFWHTPLILLGFDYPLHPALGILLITLLGMIFGTLLGWTRLKTGSVWPAVLGHAGIDASAGAILVFGRAGAPFDSAVLGLTGWTGWIVPLLIIALLVITRRLPVRRAPEPGKASCADFADSADNKSLQSESA